MPTRVYRCEKCSNEVELFQKMEEGAPNICPTCGADEAMKQVLVAGYKIRMDDADNRPLGKRYT